MRRSLVVGLLAGACLAVTPAAGANITQWRYAIPLGALSRDAGASYDELRMSEAYAESNSRKIDVGAHYPGSWTQYGMYTEGWGYACHSFSGTMTLGGLVYNPHTVSQSSVPANVYWPSWEQVC